MTKKNGRKTCGTQVLESLWLEIRLFCLKHKITVTEFVEEAYRRELKRRNNNG